MTFNRLHIQRTSLRVYFGRHEQRLPNMTGNKRLEPVCTVETVLVAVAHIICRGDHHTILVASINLHLNETVTEAAHSDADGKCRASRKVGAFPLMTSSGKSLPDRPLVGNLQNGQPGLITAKSGFPRK